jgi:hypothetical protein
VLACLSTYYLLGKNRPGSGILYLCSRCALRFHAAAVMPIMTRLKTAVLAFQFDGWVYQPPAGDQTCLGYLDALCQRARGVVHVVRSTYGILPPPP